jgi:uncharacterized membrane protein YbhN (UPF0104 family)
VAWVVSSLGPRRVLDVALRADPLWLALSIVPVAGRFLIWGLKWARMLRRREAVPFWLTSRMLIAGSFVNLTTPTAKLAGGFVRAALLHRRRGWDLAVAYGWAMADQITNVLGHLMLCGLLALAVGLTPFAGGARVALLGSGALVLAGIGLAAGLRGWAWNRLDRLPARLVRLIPLRFRDDSAGEALPQRVFRPLLREGGAATFVADTAWAGAAFGSLGLANAMVLRALGVDAPLLLVAAAVVVGYFAGVAVGAWGGIGVTEAALTGLFVQLGVPPEQAAAGVLLHRAMFYAVVLVGGGFSLLYEGRPS